MSVFLSIAYFAPVHQICTCFGRIKIVVFDPAHHITALVRGAHAQRVRRVILPDVFVAAKKLDRIPQILGSDNKAVLSVTMP